ncbi:MAG: Cytochrome c-type biogenesis protein DsbD, protein-disulfide reductase (EC [uncultured Sulfurovum sp.]|uniref:Cytochrome c-type biogenesis protein DsbD, protein-disulfide reductase (EC) n=1 Tax=uncultured Sulfurovum sp. TaxID=269237 RepID=A0A6S6RVS7_9BACT|nr:MAG: Cytochrome c-type biogenesis protein DsbD, protein-disulfide reductase (EC [uncultured Sulfurovum sp.]
MKFLKLLLLVTTIAFAGFGPKVNNDGLLSAEEAFIVTAVQNGDVIETKIILGDKIHVTANTLKYSIVAPEKIALSVKAPPAHEVDGDMVYDKEILVNIPLKEIYSKVSGDYTLAIDFSGCSEAGICYNPISDKFTFKGNPNVEEGTWGKIMEALDQANPMAIVDILINESSFFVVLLFLIMGLLLALTPCIFPMIPILSSIIVSQQSEEEEASALKGFFISLVYVLSMAVTYTLVGVISGLLGADIQAAMQNPWVLTAFALMFFALAISLFGYYEIQLPSKWQSKINAMSDNAQGNGIIGTVIMGFLSAFIIGPCVAPPLAGAVIFISQTGDALLGGIALFAMSMGMGLPLLLVGAGAGKFMPRPGGWMTIVSQTFGVVMLALAIFMLGKVLSAEFTMLLWSLFFMGIAFYMGVFDNSSAKVGMKKLFQLFAFTSLIYGAILFIGFITNAKSILDPLEKFTSAKLIQGTVPTENTSHKLVAEAGYSIAKLEAKVQASTKPVLVDFRKKSCAACDELEAFTFPHPIVKKELERFTFITIDVTAGTDEEKALMKKYTLFGTPSILFFDKENKVLPKKTISGFVNAEKFAKHLKTIN